MSTDKMLGVRIGPHTLDQLQEQISRQIENNNTDCYVFACANPHSLVVAQNDEFFKSALNNANATVADGAGVAMVSRLLGMNTGPRITGYDFFEMVMNHLESKGGRVFFFGSSEGVLDKISNQLEKQYPNIILTGAISPPFRPWSDEENKNMIDIINQSKPDVLWVGMTAPKQEKWIEANRNILEVPVTGAIGAVFDFFAGTYPRAPSWATRMSLEWLFRLVKEPGRMWRRNFISTPLFLVNCLLQHVILKTHKR